MRAAAVHVPLHRAHLQHHRVSASNVITETDLPHLAGRALHEQRRSMQTIPCTPMTVLFRNCLLSMRTKRSCTIGMPAGVAAPAGLGRSSVCSQPHAALMRRQDQACQHAFCGAASGHIELQSQVAPFNTLISRALVSCSTHTLAASAAAAAAVQLSSV